MINERQFLKDTLYDWVAAVVAETGRKDEVIWRNDKGPRPKPPFIAIEFTGSQVLGSPDYTNVEGVEKEEDAGEQQIRQSVRRALTMYAFGEGAIDLLETIRASIYRSQYIDMLHRAGLVIPFALEVTENPTNTGNEIENSAFFEFVVTYIRVVIDVPGWIGGVIVSPDKDLPMDVINITTATEE